MTKLRLISPAIAAFISCLPLHSEVLVELFTSQGCSSCPPADEFMEEIAERDDVVALAYHVDYWDYLGHVDAFANPLFTQRQYAYQARRGEKQVFTPHFILDGQVNFAGAKSDEILSGIAKLDQETPIKYQIQDKKLVFQPIDNLEGRYEVMLANYIKKSAVKIADGENAGRKITYVNAVQNLQRIARWDGTTVLSVRLPETDDGMGCAIFIQEALLGPVVFAKNFCQ